MSSLVFVLQLSMRQMMAALIARSLPLLMVESGRQSPRHIGSGIGVELAELHSYSRFAITVG